MRGSGQRLSGIEDDSIGSQGLQWNIVPEEKKKKEEEEKKNSNGKKKKEKK